MLAIILLVIGIASRLVVHIPNFTPVIALSLFGGVYLKEREAKYLPLVLLAVSDLILGLHNTMIFTWGSIFVISLMGVALKKNKTSKSIFANSLWASLLFFVVTNLGVWIVSGMYPLTLSGLTECFVLAIPFFRTEVLSTLIYTVVFFGSYELIAARIKNTRFASAL